MTKEVNFVFSTRLPMHIDSLNLHIGRIKMATSKLFSVCIQRRSDIYRISESFCEVSPTLWQKGNSVTGDLPFVSLGVLKDNIHSLISQKTGVEFKSIKVQKIVFYKIGKQVRVKKI